jgi:hypothetical protein
MTVGQATQAAYKAGKAAGDYGDFQVWLDEKGLQDRSDTLKNRLAKEYERGHEAASGSQYSTDTHERHLAAHGLKYKGYIIREVEGGYSTSLDRESVFDSVEDAKAFLDSWNRKNPASDTYEVVENGKVVTKGSRDYARGFADMRKLRYPERSIEVRKVNNPKRNPESEADSAFESFHGTPPRETVIVEEQIHEHEHLWNCGRLIEMVIDTLTGKELHLTWEETEAPFLSCSEDGKQLYIEGGDQELDLASIGMDSDRWVKDRMVVGTFAAPRGKRNWNLTYRTKKDFDGFEEIDYQHWLGEPSKELPNPSAPLLEYDPISKKLYVSGGQYIITKPLFGTSPGIEN